MTDTNVATGEFVAQHLNNGNVPEENIQPNGVDLRIDKIYRASGQVYFGNDDYVKSDRMRIEPREDGEYKIPPGSYPIVYREQIEIPEGYIGRVYPRSRVMRSGLHLTSALWDQGYEGVGEGLLQVPQSMNRTVINEDASLAQMVFYEASAETDTYDGTHQHERLEAE